MVSRGTGTGVRGTGKTGVASRGGKIRSAAGARGRGFGHVSGESQRVVPRPGSLNFGRGHVSGLCHSVKADPGSRSAGHGHASGESQRVKGWAGKDMEDTTPAVPSHGISASPGSDEGTSAVSVNSMPRLYAVIAGWQRKTPPVLDPATECDNIDPDCRDSTRPSDLAAEAS